MENYHHKVMGKHNGEIQRYGEIERRYKLVQDIEDMIILTNQFF